MLPVITNKTKNINERWRKGLEKSITLRMLRRVALFGIGALTAYLVIKVSEK
ncbi:hypothetical protein [Thermodesulfatator atlanticus]|uniref:hypothetical protein n=1 Tax=Thermodesulfatator atlanticus TaxID=501497 RepID=UPI0003B6299B|nr:hypothetical protein [Thermodesulfatator atlanticus]